MPGSRIQRVKALRWTPGLRDGVALAGTAVAALLLAPAPPTASPLPERPATTVASSGAAAARPANSPEGGDVQAVELSAFWGPLTGRYRPRPGGRPLLLIGAGGRSLDGLDPLARRLQQDGWSVLAIRNPVNILRKDRQGYPIIDKRRLSTGGIPDLARDAESAVRYLAERTDLARGMVIVGEGLGVPIAAHLAASDARVAAVAFVTPAKECDPSATRAVLEKACERKPALLVLGHKDEVYRSWFLDREGASANVTVVDPTARPGGVEAEQAAWAAYEFPFVEDVVSWLKTLPAAGPS